MDEGDPLLGGLYGGAASGTEVFRIGRVVGLCVDLFHVSDPGLGEGIGV